MVKKIKSAIQDKIGKEGTAESSSSPEKAPRGDEQKVHKNIGENHEKSNAIRIRIGRSGYTVRGICPTGTGFCQHGHDDGNSGDSQRG
jgi:hypothetical protein